MSTVTASSSQEHRITVRSLAGRKRKGRPITMLTAYDFTFARIFDAAGIELLLVGDSLGNVVQGCETTLPVTLDEVIYHTRLVARGASRALVIGDMPFGSYQVSPEDALRSAIRLVKEGGAHAVKLEGGCKAAASIERIVSADIPVMGHVGLTPQSVHKLGGFKVQGREEHAAQEMITAARELENAGADTILLECVPNAVGAAIRDAVRVPVIGIGAGPGVDGQILVLYDVLGITQGRTPRFVKNFAKDRDSPLDALRAYVRAVKDRSYPAPEHCFTE